MIVLFWAKFPQLRQNQMYFCLKKIRVSFNRQRLQIVAEREPWHDMRTQNCQEITRSLLSRHRDRRRDRQTIAKLSDRLRWIASVVSSLRASLKVCFVSREVAPSHFDSKRSKRMKWSEQLETKSNSAESVNVIYEEESMLGRMSVRLETKTTVQWC